MAESWHNFRADRRTERHDLLHTSRHERAAGDAGVRPPVRKGAALEVAVGASVFLPHLLSLDKRWGRARDRSNGELYHPMSAKPSES